MKAMCFVRMAAVMSALLVAVAEAALPLAPQITWPAAGAIVNVAQLDLTWNGSSHDTYEIRISSFNSPNSVADGWNSGQVASAANAATTPVLTRQKTWFLFIRLHNADGWGPWSESTHYFYIAGELLNDPYLIAGPVGTQDVQAHCYNPDRNEYLIAYLDSSKGEDSVISYYRLDGTGAKIGNEMWIIDSLQGSGAPFPCYNSARKEYLIAYSGYTPTPTLHSEIRTQRIDAATGAPIGGSNWIFSDSGNMLSRVAYSTVHDSYLLIWENGGGAPPLPVYAQRLDSTAVPQGPIFRVSNDTYYYAGDPSICYNSVNDEFFVTFQDYYDGVANWNSHAQRVRASDGALLGPNITISATTDDDADPDVAFDSNLNRYMVIYSGGDPSPWVQFVSASGTLIGAKIPVAPPSSSNAYYPGGMAGIAWNPLTKEYLVTWGSCCSAGNFCRRLSQNGAYIGEPLRTNGDVQGFGNWIPLPAVNTVNNEYLISWYWQYDNVYVRRFKAYPSPANDTTAPASVTGLSLTRYAGAIGLNWTNPSTSDFSGTMIRFKTTGFPTSPTDGTLVVDSPNAPGTTDGYTHGGLSKGTYYYAAFAHDVIPNYATATLASAIVQPGDFNGDGDVDQADFGHLQICFSGPSVAFASGCADADLDANGDVSSGDLSIFLGCLRGSDLPPGC